MGQDIYSPNTGDTTIHNFGVVINPGGPFIGVDNGAIDSSVSYADGTIPVIANLTGLYHDKFDDPTYYTA
jgi:hypothetical protein